MRAQGSRRGAKRERGVALLLAVISITLLMLMATEFAFNSRVDLQLAANQRDEIRAYYLARSGIGLSRMLLRFQKQVDAIQIPNLFGPGGPLGGLKDLATGGKPPAPGAPQASSLNIQLWRMAKVDCNMLSAMVVADDPKSPASSRPPPRSKKFEFDDDAPELAEKQKARNFGGFEGCFQATIGNEEEKINLGKLDSLGANATSTLTQLLALMGDKRYEFLWEKEDANRVKAVPTEVIIAIKDWIDEDEVQSSINQSGVGTAFQKGFSDENFNYDRYQPRYRAKNARFDTLDELFQIHGVNDQFMAAFRDVFTVYPNVNSKLNVNSEDYLRQIGAIIAVADPNRPDPRLKDPLFLDSIVKKIRAAKMFALFGLSVTDFVNIVASSGVAVNSSIINNVSLAPVGDKSTTYSIKSVGQAGAVEKTITTVVQLDDGLGKLLYWREE